jgi:hypothetical protein
MIRPLDYHDVRKERPRGPRPVDWVFLAGVLAGLAWYARLVATRGGNRGSSYDFTGPAFCAAGSACAWALFRLHRVPADTRILCFPITLTGVTVSLNYGMTLLRNWMHW